MPRPSVRLSEAPRSIPASRHRPIMDEADRSEETVPGFHTAQPYRRVPSD